MTTTELAGAGGVGHISAVDGIVISLVAAFAWWVIGYCLLRVVRRLRFHRLSGRYRVDRKVSGVPTDATVTLRRRRGLLEASNTFELVYEFSRDRGDVASGVIAMSDSISIRGEGAYTHENSDTRDMSGTLSVVAARRPGEPVRLLVERRYAKTYEREPGGKWREATGDVRREVLAAFVWTQIEPFPDRLSRAWDLVASAVARVMRA